MSDHFHLSNETQESYEYYLRQLTESPSTTSSPISPITTTAPNHPAMFNWQPSIDPSSSLMNPYYHDHFQNQPIWPAVPQHQQYLSHSTDHTPSVDSTQNYDQPVTSYFQQQPTSSIPTFNNSTYTTAAPIGEQVHAYHPHIDSNLPSPLAQQSSSFDQQGPSSSSPRYQPQTKKKKVTNHINSTDSTDSTSPPSPNTTPIPSPILSNTRRKRRASTTVARKKQDSTPEKSKQRASVVDRIEQDQDEQLEGAIIDQPEDSEPKRKNNRSVDQMDNELAFLRDELATITIMLDSLRNAFLADLPTASSSTTVASAKRIASSTATINFMVEKFGSSSSTTTSAPTQTNSSTTNKADKRRRSKTLAQNPEMEREMRIAYDDLMIQVRQLEKKVERLEGICKRMKKHGIKQKDQPSD
jgi:hypothetical protein